MKGQLVEKPSTRPEPQLNQSERASPLNPVRGQSKRWMSERTKERQAFSKLMSNLRHIGADKSPFIPQSLTELAAFKTEVAEANKRELARVVRHRLAELERRKTCLAEGPSALHSAKIGKLFWGKLLNDKLSPVFLSVNCFNVQLSDDHELRVDWPSLAELKEEGDKRGGHYGRYLPLPRFNVVDPRMQGMPREELFNADGTIRWQMKALNTEPAFIVPVSPPPGRWATTRSPGRGLKSCRHTCSPKPAMILEL